MRALTTIALCALSVAVTTAAQSVPAYGHPVLHRGCTNTLLGHYYVGVGHVSCRFAVRAVRRMVRGGPRPAGWHGRGPLRCRPSQEFGHCYSRGRVFHWAGSE
jgi:hypothetical protein